MGYRTTRHQTWGSKSYGPGDQVDINLVPAGRLASMLRLGTVILDPTLPDVIVEEPPVKKSRSKPKPVDAETETGGVLIVDDAVDVEAVTTTG